VKPATGAGESGFRNGSPGGRFGGSVTLPALNKKGWGVSMINPVCGNRANGSCL